MRAIPINFLAIVGAAAVKMALGAFWYSPALFLKSWQRLSGVTEQQMKAGMGKALAVDFVGSLLMAFVLVNAIGYAGAVTVPHGMAVGFWNWLGFIAVATIGTVTYEGKPFQLWLLNNSYLLLSVLVMSAILAVWA